VENVRLIDRHQNQKATSGTLYVTATHLIFVDPAGKRETWVSIPDVVANVRLFGSVKHLFTETYNHTWLKMEERPGLRASCTVTESIQNKGNVSDIS
jgi:hypothetical protein